MMYPLKFIPVYKDYVWGGRNFEKLGRKLPDGIVAESWEISCHPNGLSIISNGEHAGKSLVDLINQYGRKVIGDALPDKDLKKFPLLVKLIDASNKLSVQVHPDDNYAFTHENGEYGKNEMWYIMSAKPGAKLIYDVVPGTTRETFAQAVKNNDILSCLKQVEVFPGDVINIPAGLVHAIGEGIMLAEIQQNSDTTYRVYDYDRTDSHGNKRPLHIEKALDVIDFNSENRKEKAEGLTVKLDDKCFKTYYVANKYFSVELYDIDGAVSENPDGKKFHMYVFTEGNCEIESDGSRVEVAKGESILIPASMGGYTMKGSFKALKSYVPDVETDILQPLMEAGFSKQEIFEKVSGLK